LIKQSNVLLHYFFQIADEANARKNVSLQI
jgi:hypothetical protein